MLKNLKFSQKVMLMPLLAGLGIIVIFVFVLLGSVRTRNQVEAAQNRHVPALELARDLDQTIEGLQRALQDAAAAADTGFLQEADKARDVVLATIKEGKKNQVIEVRELQDLEDAFNNYYTTARDTTQRMINKITDSNLSVSLERMRSGYSSLRQRLATLRTTTKANMRFGFDGILKEQSSSVTLIIVVMIVVACVLAFLSLSVIRSVTLPIKQVGEIARALAEGRFNVRIHVESKDEMGAMAGAVNGALDKLGYAIKTIAESANSLGHSADGLTTVSHQMASSADETATRAYSVSSAADQVSKSVQTVATAVEEMTASIREIARNAHEAARVATDAVRVADTTNNTIAKLGESSSQISNVVKVITSIAEQTNLLALNATIEAARAGEAGKGFAVVANEVKELAKATAHATEEIGARILTIQSDSAGAVEAIGRIGTIIKQIYDIQNTIASAVEEQTATTNEIARNVADAARGSTEIARSITGVAQAAQGTSAGVASAQQAAQELSTMAEELQKLVAQFSA